MLPKSGHPGGIFFGGISLDDFFFSIISRTCFLNSNRFSVDSFGLPSGLPRRAVPGAWAVVLTSNRAMRGPWTFTPKMVSSHLTPRTEQRDHTSHPAQHGDNHGDTPRFTTTTTGERKHVGIQPHEFTPKQTSHREHTSVLTPHTTYPRGVSALGPAGTTT